MYIDQLVTSRLYTRHLQATDAEVWAEFMKNEKAIAFTPFVKEGSFESDVAKAEFWLSFQFKRYAENRYGLQALIHNETQEYIGQSGLLLQNVDEIDELEVAYHIMPHRWGMGYASEAAQAFRDFGFNTTKVKSLISIIDVNNIASQNVAVKNGMTRERQTSFRGLDVFIYRITREKWEQLKSN